MSDAVLDRQCGKPRLMSEQCATCIFRPGNKMHLRRGRLKDITQQALDAGTYIVCHDTLPGMSGMEPAICRGFFDGFGHLSNLLRIFGRLGGFVEVQPRKKEDEL